jgi:hypothetical protein
MRSVETIMRPSAKTTLLTATITAALTLSGCAEWATYDEDFRLPGGGGATLDDFSATTLQHLQLRGLMSSYLGVAPGMGAGYVLLDYDAIRASDEARHTLGQYLAVLASVDPSKLASPDERLAYWINAYNAAVIHGVVNKYMGNKNYRVTDDGMFFDDPLYTFGGVEAMNTNHIEQGVLRGEWGHASLPRSGKLLEQLQTWHKELWGSGKIDPRFHAAVNCAALSCPNLLAVAPYAYDAATLDQQLDDAVKQWLDNPDKGAGPGGISKLFDWYRSDFEASHGSVDAFITAFRTEGLKGVNTSNFLTYDWTLNIKGAKK